MCLIPKVLPLLNLALLLLSFALSLLSVTLDVKDYAEYKIMLLGVGR